MKYYYKKQYSSFATKVLSNVDIVLFQTCCIEKILILQSYTDITSLQSGDTGLQNKVEHCMHLPNVDFNV